MKQVRLKTAPATLVLHLKRFRASLPSGLAKCADPVQVLFILDYLLFILDYLLY